MPIEGVADANYAGCKDTFRSRPGQLFCMNGAAVSWASILQPTVAQSTTEAEYMASAAATKEALWHRKLRRDMQLRADALMQLLGDNQGALALVKDPVLHARTSIYITMQCVSALRTRRSCLTTARLQTW